MKNIEIQPQKECSSCKRKNMNGKEIGLLILSIYMLFACVYGTIELIKDISHYLR